MTPEWMESARCKGMDTNLWFPERGELGDEAKAVCAQCPVQRECLSYSLTLESQVAGIWGGVSANQRRGVSRPVDLRTVAPRKGHGTDAAYKAHARQRTEPCAACRSAHAEYSRRKKYEARQRVSA